MTTSICPLGYSLFSASTEECINIIYDSIVLGNKRSTLGCLNPHSYYIAQKDFRFNLALRAFNWLVPDGIGIVFATRFLGFPMKSRITGYDIFYGLNCLLNKRGNFTIFFLGGTNQTLIKIQKRMAIDFPNITICGFYSPPFKNKFSNQDNMDIINIINKSNPDVLWVGLSAPKQEKWIIDNIEKLDVKFAAGVGAVFDFYVGNIKRSNIYMQKIGFEWLPRLLQEPNRLWRRTFISAPLFITYVLKIKLGNIFKAK